MVRMNEGITENGVFSSRIRCLVHMGCSTSEFHWLAWVVG
jgi:hypothetical protein